MRKKKTIEEETRYLSFCRCLYTDRYLRPSDFRQINHSVTTETKEFISNSTQQRASSFPYFLNFLKFLVSRPRAISGCFCLFFFGGGGGQGGFFLGVFLGESWLGGGGGGGGREIEKKRTLARATDIHTRVHLLKNIVQHHCVTFDFFRRRNSLLGR